MKGGGGGQGDKINRSSVRLKWAQDCAPLSKMSGELAQPTPVAMATLCQFQPAPLTFWHRSDVICIRPSNFPRVLDTTVIFSQRFAYDRHIFQEFWIPPSYFLRHLHTTVIFSQRFAYDRHIFSEICIRPSYFPRDLHTTVIFSQRFAYDHHISS